MTRSSAPQNAAASVDELMQAAGRLIAEQRFEEALGPLRSAATLQPNNGRVQTTLGGVYIECGQPVEALEHLCQAVELNPKIAIAHWRIGIALHMLGEIDSATHALEEAVRIRPNLTDAHFRLALLYREQGRRSEALASHRNAAESASEPGERAFLEAHLHRMEGREPKAEALLRFALEKRPDLPAVHGILGQILAEAGRFDEAAHHFEEQLARTPNAGLCYYDLVRSRRMSEADLPLLEKMNSVLENSDLDDANKAVLLLARGKLLDDLGRYEEAMKTLDAASQLRSRAFSLRIEDFERQVDAIIALFSRETLTECVLDNDEGLPVLIVGMPRSGTTLVEQIVSTHPLAAGAGELAFWRKRLQLALLAGPSALNSHALTETAAAFIAELRTISQSAIRISDKDPFNFLAIGLFHLAFPKAAIVHCRRDPADTAISIHQTHFAKSTGMPTGGEDLVRYFYGYQRLMAHWRQVLPRDTMLEVEYERLTAAPQVEIRKVIDFIGLPWDPACLNPHVNTRLVRTPSGWQVRQSINTGSVGRWKKYEPWLGPLAALVAQPKT